MKKIISLILVLCLVMASVPVFAESTESGSGLLGMLSGILEGNGESGGIVPYIIQFLIGLKTKLAGNRMMVRALVSLVVDKLKEKLSGKLGGLGNLLDGLSGLTGDASSGESGESALGGLESLLGGLGGLTGETGSGESGESAMGGLETLLGSLGGLTGGESDSGDLSSLTGLISSMMSGSELSESGELSEEEKKEYEETVARINENAEKETGAGVAGKKTVENIEEFYGNWKYDKLIIFGEETSMSDYDAGMFIGENTYYATTDGKKDPDYMNSETVEMKLTDGVLKIKINDMWSVYVLTEDGTLVEPGEAVEYRYTRVAE